MISWLDATSYQQFGDSLAESVMNLLEREGKAKQKKKLSQHELVRKLLPRIAEFNAEYPGNLYKRAKFGNAFKWKLLDANCDAEFVDELTKELLIHFR